MSTGAAATAAAVVLLCAVAPGVPLAAQDRMTVADASGLPGRTIRVALYVRDASGTTLDEGDGPDLEIQGFAFRADFPPTWVTGVNFEKAGVTAGHAHLFQYIDPAADHLTVLLSFDETTDPLAFILDRAAPGDLIGNLIFATNGAAPLETVIPIGLVAATATLVNDSGTLDETVADSMLALTDGQIRLSHNIFADGFESGDVCAWSASVPPAVCP